MTTFRHTRSPGVLAGIAASGLILAALTLTGCGVNTPATPKAAAGTAAAADGHVTEWDVARMPDPCRTIQAAEVTRIVNRTAQPGTKLDSWPPLCRFVLQPASSLVFVSDNSLPTGAQEYEELKHSGQAVTPVTGLGDQAYWVPELRTLHVMVGKDHLKVLFSGTDLPPVAQARTQTEALARTAIGRLSAG
jgi:hypothetical protein